MRRFFLDKLFRVGLFFLRKVHKHLPPDNKWEPWAEDYASMLQYLDLYCHNLSVGKASTPWRDNINWKDD